MSTKKLVGACATALALGPAATLAQVTPSEVNVALKPGESATVTKTVVVPAIPPKLDLCLLVDLSGSYFDDLPHIRSVAPGLFDSIRATVADSTFCLATFVDYPQTPWGVPGDYAYQLNQNLTADRTTWLNAINLMTIRNGNDIPESQYEGLYQMATGAGRDVPPAGPSTGDVPAGLNPTFRPDATRVIAITTDAPFHNPGDPGCGGAGCPFNYPGPSQADTINALVAAGIKVIAIKAPGSGGEMDAIALGTGGAVVTTAANSSQIATAILAGLQAILQDITATPVGCDPLAVTFVPAAHLDVAGPTAVTFAETISVPGDATPGTLQSCSVEFKSDDTVLGVQQITVQVPNRGRMTGGGSIVAADGMRVTHGFTLNCYSGAGGENLQVNFGGNSFHLASLTQAQCFDNPAVAEGGAAGFDTYQGKGVGSFNGTPGYKAEWRFTDAGEPGRNDTAELVITDPSGNIVLNVGGNLRNGNHQAHRD
jgi:hypothetical protein